MKSRFYGLNDEQCSVEELALQYYASEEGGGWQGVHRQAKLEGSVAIMQCMQHVPDCIFGLSVAFADLHLSSWLFCARSKVGAVILNHGTTSLSLLQRGRHLGHPVRAAAVGCAVHARARRLPHAVSGAGAMHSILHFWRVKGIFFTFLGAGA